MKGVSAQNEISAAEKQLRKFRVTDARVEVLGEGVLDDVTRVIRGTVRRGSGSA
jgi:16S rRNA (guanine527-N7)-methyltransferase